MLLLFGLRHSGYLLARNDPIPDHAEVAVVLDGTPEGVAARFDMAIDLLEQGRADHVIVSVGNVWVWGNWFPQMVETYVEKNYAQDVASRIVVCGMNTDSTQEEALALRKCLDGRGWKSILVVTSNYHAFRARHIWRQLYKAPYTISVYGVTDGDFEPSGWWHSRRYAKTWLLETTKLVWSYISGS